MSTVTLDSPAALRTWTRESSSELETKEMGTDSRGDVRDDSIPSGAEGGFVPEAEGPGGIAHPGLGLREPPRSLQNVIDDIAQFTSTAPPQSTSEVVSLALARVDHPEEIAAVVHFFVSASDSEKLDVTFENLRYFVSRRGPEHSRSDWLRAIERAENGTLELPESLTAFSLKPKNGRILHRDVRGRDLRQVMAALYQIAQDDPEGHTHVYLFNGSVEISASRDDELGELIAKAEAELANAPREEPNPAQEKREEIEANRREMKANAQLLVTYASQPARSVQDLVDDLSTYSLTEPPLDLPVREAASRLEHPEEIRAFAATYFASSPDAAIANVEYLVNVKAVRLGTVSFWQQAVSAMKSGDLDVDPALLNYQPPQPGDTIRHRAVDGHNTKEVAANLAAMAKDDGFVHVYDFNSLGNDMVAHPGDSGDDVLRRWEKARAAA